MRLQGRAAYAEAERLCQRALGVYEKTHGATHERTLTAAKVHSASGTSW